MTFELWLFAIKHLGQTYDAALAIYNTFPEDRKEELRKEYEETQGGNNK
jgi:hypothetical protein